MCIYLCLFNYEKLQSLELNKTFIFSFRSTSIVTGQPVVLASGQLVISSGRSDITSSGTCCDRSAGG